MAGASSGLNRLAPRGLGRKRVALALVQEVRDLHLVVQQASHFAGAYQDLATQQRLANEEKQRGDAGVMGEGLFALQDLQPGELQLSYFGKYYAGFSRYSEDDPNDDSANTMEL